MRHYYCAYVYGYARWIGWSCTDRYEEIEEIEDVIAIAREEYNGESLIMEIWTLEPSLNKPYVCLFYLRKTPSGICKIMTREDVENAGW
jgi:hypothetical protein